MDNEHNSFNSGNNKSKEMTKTNAVPVIHKEDRRITRTHEAILRAFEELIIQKEFKDITITELTKRANISRKTFYSHYSSMEDILDDMQLMIAEKLISEYAKKYLKTISISNFIDTMNAIMDENYELYRRLIVANSYRFFSRNVKDLIKSVLIHKFQTKVNIKPEYANLYIEFAASGLAKVYKVWFENPNGIDKEELSSLAAQMVFNGFNGISNL